MKFLSLVLGVALLSSAAPAKAMSPALQKLVGVYESDGYRFVVSQSGNSLVLRTNAELSASTSCRTKISRMLREETLPGNNDYAEAYFQLDTSQCTQINIDGFVTLHHNVAITGVDVYLIDVVIQRSRPDRTVRWSLNKIH